MKGGRRDMASKMIGNYWVTKEGIVKRGAFCKAKSTVVMVDIQNALGGSYPSIALQCLDKT
jgi:hypothetical protein